MLPRRAAGAFLGRCSSGPLVGELPMEVTDQGNDEGDTRRRLEDLPRSRLNSTSGLGRPGVHPVSSVIGLVRPGAGSDPPLRDRSLVGGDEETRTPDPLLAKEMLCQLSYVPLGPEVWWAFLDSNQRPLPYQGSALTS